MKKLLLLLFSAATLTPILSNAQCAINAGFPMSVCEESTQVSLSATATQFTSFYWSTDGSGTFSNSTSLHPNYFPSPTDIETGHITLTISASGGSCASESADVTLTFFPMPTVYSDIDQTICAGTSVSLSATYSGGPTLWENNSGTGTFLAPVSATAIFLPSDEDVLNGGAVLSFTVAGGFCPTVVDQVLITILNEGSLHAGPDQFTTSSFVSLTGTATGIATTEWTTNGSGTFSNPTSLTTTYTPSAEDITNGIVKIRLTSTGNGPCVARPDEMLLSIGTTYSISGTITAATNPLDKGVLLLFKQGPTGLRFITSDTINYSDAGIYNFANIPVGTYVLQASPISGSSAAYTALPTYTGGTQTWNTAQTITVANNTTTNILLTPYVSADATWNTGTDLITGIITVSADAAANARTAINDVVAAFVVVYLTDVNGNIITYTLTDINGRYKFENVKAGTYFITTDFAGTELNNAAISIPVTVDGLSSTIENVPLPLKERTSTTTGIINNTKSTKVTAYPNPASNSISIDLLNVTGTGEIKLLNEIGVVKMQQQIELSAPTVTLQIESLPAGIYLLQLVTDNEVFTSKVVKY